MMVHHAGKRVRVEQHRAGEHLEGHDAEGVLIALRTGAPAGTLLGAHERGRPDHRAVGREGDRKSTRLNSSHGYISYAVFCLKKKNKRQRRRPAGASLPDACTAAPLESATP